MKDRILVSAEEFYAELRMSLALPSVREAYAIYNRVLRIAADQKTDFDTLHLGSLYAKLDYLVREYHVDRNLALRINDTRVRLRSLLRLDDEGLGLCRLIDLRAICLFISTVYGAAVPSDLAQRLPADIRPAKDTSIVADCFRLVLTRYDEVYLYGTCVNLPEEEEVRVCYHYTGGTGNGDNTYLRPFLRRGVQLNVIRPQLYDKTYFPELLILDPDFLVDITAVTACFEDYTHDARLSLLSKLRSNDDTPSTMLGNLASQLLDEEVHSGVSDERPYEESYAAFMRENAFKALTVDIDTLYEEGERQRQNIVRSLREGLQKRLGHYDRSQVMLEPSFVCEMLGLQGRMDFLQLDYRVLIEQKAGKGQWYPGMRDDQPPREHLKHRVQLLLYQAILHYGYGIANSSIQLLLLYSRYERGLIGVTPAPQLLTEAIRLRNQIAGLEALACQGGWQEILSTLRPEQLPTLPIRENFWQNYKLPELRRLLDPIREVSPLERAYYYRFLTFIANEHTLAKVGNHTKESSGFAARWHDSLQDKYQVGNIYDQLRLIAPDAEHQGQVTELLFAIPPERRSEMSDFRQGDIVVAYQYDVKHDPDLRQTMVLRGSIAAITVDTLRIRLRAPQSPPRRATVTVDGDCQSQIPTLWSDHHRPWAVEHDFMESSYRSLYSGMHSFLSAPVECRQLLLLQRRPKVDAEAVLNGEYGSFTDLAIRVKQAQELFLVIGPPGTGKTSYGMLNTVREQLTVPGSQILITSFTNRAVDEICSKLTEDGIDYIRVGGLLTCSPEYRSHVLSERLAGVDTLLQMRQLVQQTRVIVGTTASLSASQQLFSLKSFDLAIIDEASQILEPHLMGMLCARGVDGKSAIRKMVMIGDHKQLPAVVQQSERVSVVNDAALQAIGLTDCRLSLFERLLTRYRHDPQVVYMLTRQGRMHQDIADWPNRMFYGGKLQVVPLEHQVAALTAPAPSDAASDTPAVIRQALSRRVAWIDVPIVEPVIIDKVNQPEAQLIAQLVHYIYHLCMTSSPAEAFDPYQTVGVIVPYRNQIAAVRSAIDLLSLQHGLSAPEQEKLHDITIDTVERYQGSQRDYILYGFTVQRPYQLNFLTSNTFEEDGQLIDRKLNVAMTRARKHLVMLGDSRLVGQVPLFAELIEYLKN